MMYYFIVHGVIGWEVSVVNQLMRRSSVDILRNVAYAFTESVLKSLRELINDSYNRNANRVPDKNIVYNEDEIFIGHWCRSPASSMDSNSHFLTLHWGLSKYRRVHSWSSIGMWSIFLLGEDPSRQYCEMKRGTMLLLLTTDTWTDHDGLHIEMRVERELILIERLQLYVYCENCQI